MSVNHIYRSDEFFRQVTEQKCWTAWRTEQRKNQKGEVSTTKVPYSNLKAKSESDDPTTWITIEDAAKVAATEGFINGGGGGIGIFLGIDCGNGYRLGGTDLDSCLSPDGTILSWAREILYRFDSYAEVSPSRRGVKIFFLYRDDDLDEFRRITGTKWSRNFKERMDSHHPPGFELHLGHRYFAITGDLYDGCPASMRLVEA